MPEDNQQNPKKDSSDTSYIGIGVALGVAIGAGLSVALDNFAFIGVGIAIGVALGAAFDQNQKNKS